MLTPSTPTLEHNRPLPRCYPTFRGKPFFNGNTQALAWALDGAGRAIAFIGSGAFFATTLLRLAKEAAGCPTEPLEGETEIPPCDEKIYGIKPSSLLTTYTMVVGLVSATLLPLMGAIIDYTPHRLRLGRITSFFFCILVLPLAFMNENNFAIMAIIQIFVALIGWAQTGITYAYLPELTDDEGLLNDYTKVFTASSFMSMVLYLAMVIGVLSAFGVGDNDILVNKVGMSVAFVVNVFLLTISWGFLFNKREALHQLPSDRSLWSSGFIQLWDTSKHIYQNYRALKWFYLAISMSDAGLQALATISITYLTDKLQFTARENGIAIICMLLGSVPGAGISKKITSRTDPFTSSKASLVLLLITTTIVALVLKGPDQHLETYILSFIWGIGTGWKWTVDRLVASSIIPDGQDTELMGFFLFSGQALSWIPPLVYTAINEAGIPQRFGVLSMDAYFFLSMLCYYLAGSYKHAREEVNKPTTYDKTSVQQSTIENSKEIDPEETGEQGGEEVEQVP